MTTLPWTPWRKAVQLRPDLLTGELTLSMFAADLHAVMTQRQDTVAAVYSDPAAFFGQTYPTYTMREVAWKIAQRLRGASDAAVRQLSLTYGGGKSHFLITLYYLFNAQTQLPDLPAVDEFRSRIGAPLPRARVAAIPFDNLDPELGMFVRDPAGNTRRLRYPWSVLAYQIAGDAGLAAIGSGGDLASERDTPPFANVMTDLLRIPEEQGLGLLILLDEVLMWARTMSDQGPAWAETTKNFFQFLSQAATQVRRCAVVVSLLASDPKKYDERGRTIASELGSVLQRLQEENVLPVLKEDVAEVLRRRLFAPASLLDRSAYRAHALAAVEGIKQVDELARKDAAALETRFEASYPFHPDLTDLFYSKWTALETFQRTRGVLRTYALALRDAAAWDDAPLIAANVFLSEPGAGALSPAAEALAEIARADAVEGRQQSWPNILVGELAAARAVQQEFGGLRHREVEQAVFAIFLHSQPVGLLARAQTRELLALVGATRPDKIELEKALAAWAERSWFLDDSDGADRTAWRLGLKPNLTQMHHDAVQAVAADPVLVTERLLSEIGKLKALTEGVNAAGGRGHLLPERPRDVENDGEFHFAVLGPEAAGEAGAPSPLALRFLAENTGPDNPRTAKNAIVLVTPARTGLDLARDRVRDYLGWEEVRSRIKDLELDALRIEKLNLNLEIARRRIPDAVRQAWCIVVTYDAGGAPVAFRVVVPDDKTPLFQIVKAAPAARIQETAVRADALLPGGPYDLWRPGEERRFVKDIVGAFAENPRLPKMVKRSAIVETLVQGCVQGLYVLSLRRPDGSVRTFWRQAPDEVALKEPALELVLPEAAELTSLPAALLSPGALPELWDTTGDALATRPAPLAFSHLCAYFSGQTVIQVTTAGYAEPLPVPRASRSVLEAAVAEQVSQGRLWLTSGPASLLKEEVPAGLLTDDALLRPPPVSIPVTDLLPAALPAAWTDGVATAESIAAALSARAGARLPWLTVRQAIDDALRTNWLELTVDSGAWPCAAGAAAAARFQPTKMAQDGKGAPAVKEITPANRLVAEAQLTVAEVQELGERIGEIKKLLAGVEMTVTVRIEVGEAGAEALDAAKGVLGEVGLRVG